jgi:hypothetical protein
MKMDTRSRRLMACAVFAVAAYTDSTAIAQSPWVVDSVASAGDVGFYNSLAFAPNGFPAIAYSDQTNDDVRFAIFDGFSWQTMLVDGGRNVAEGVDLAYNVSGKPGISYGGGALKLAEWTGQAWNIQTIVKNGAGGDTSLVYDGDTPYVAFSSGTGRAKQLQLAHRVSGNWSVEVIGRVAAGYMSLAFDPSASPVIAFAEANANNQYDTLRLARKVGSAWQIETVVTGTVGFGVFADLAFDAFGNPGIVHGNGVVRYVAWTGQWSVHAGSWSSSIVDPGPFARGESLRMSPSGPVVSLHQIQGDGFPDNLKIATGTVQGDGSVTWQREMIASTTSPEDFSRSTSLAIDAAGRPTVSVCLGRARDLLFVHQVP